MSNYLLANGSMTLVLVWLIVGGLGAPLPEDLALLAAGALAYHGIVPLPLALVLTFSCVLVGDVMLFLLARRLGPAAYDRPLFQRMLPARRRERVEAAYRRHGGKIVFLARHVAGIRAATFALAGIHGMSLRRFLAWDALAACISVPLMVVLGYVGALHIDQVRAGVARVEHYVVLAVIVAIVAALVIRWIRKRERD